MKLAGLYKDVGRIEDQIRLVKRVVAASTKTLAGDRSSNWYAYQRVYGSYNTLAVAYRDTHQDRSAFEMLRKYFSETEPYVAGRDHSKMLAETAEFNAENLARLWKQHEATFGKGGMKRFTIPTDFSGKKFPFHIYVAETWEFINDQFTWVSRIRGGEVPKEVRDSFARLYKIAKDNNVSFQELCVYALGTAAGGTYATDDLIEAPPFASKSWDFSKDNPVAQLEEIEALKQKLEAAMGGKLEKRRLIAKYLNLSEREAAKEQFSRAANFLQDARSYLKLDSTGNLTDRSDADLYCYANWVDAGVLAMQGKWDRAHELALSTLRSQPSEISAEFAMPAGGLEFLLGWVCSKMGRSVESCLWYQRSAVLGHDFVPRNLSRVYLAHPEIEEALPEDARKSLKEEMGKYMLQLVEPVTKLYNSKKVTKDECYTAARKCGLAFQYVSVLKSTKLQKTTNEPSAANAQLLLMQEPIRQSAIFLLQNAVDKGYNEFDKLRKESEFESLHGLPEFEALCKK